MSTRLSKLSDLARRWVENLVWVQTGYWQPDPLDPPDPDYPDDPIEEEPLPLVGYYVTYQSWPNVPPSMSFGVIPEGYVLVLGIVVNGSYISYYTWYEPA